MSTIVNRSKNFLTKSNKLYSFSFRLTKTLSDLAKNIKF